MQIKNVDNFNLQDCEKFLNENPNSELANAVKIRQTQLMKEILQSRKKDEETRKTQINSYREKMKWVSIEQFNAKKRYRDFSKICILFISFCVVNIILGMASDYYIDLRKTRELDYVYIDEFDYLSPLEKTLINLGFMSMNITNKDYVDISYGTENIWIYMFHCCWISALLLFGFSSPLIKRIYNIQKIDKSQKYRAIQNKQGQMGLCKVGRFKIKKVLPFNYDDIFMICNNSYICQKDGKYGIYNTELKKMLVPIQYDDIYAITDDSIELVMNSQVHRFTHKGYRIVNQ